MKLIVAGGREFNNKDLLFDAMDKLLHRLVEAGEEITIISGCARGADRWGIAYAQARGYAIEEYPADWNKYGRSAGYRRNELMAEKADGLVAFWDGKSRGTQHMIRIAKERGLEVRVIKY